MVPAGPGGHGQGGPPGPGDEPHALGPAAQGGQLVGGAGHHPDPAPPERQAPVEALDHGSGAPGLVDQDELGGPGKVGMKLTAVLTVVGTKVGRSGQ
jgi:hypothetical protein